MARYRKVVVPASSANLGPGYDVLAAALSPRLELEVSESDTFSIDPGDMQLPADESNLCVRAFAKLHSVDGLAFNVRSEIPVSGGLGSSAAAIVAGLVAADHLYELGLTREQILQQAVDLEGHPDNVAASLYGGFVVCSDQDGCARVDRLEPPTGLEAVAVTPTSGLSTSEARAAIPDEISLADATANLSSISLLTLGLARGDWDLITRGLGDKIHQQRRAHLYPQSIELMETATEIGALGATISGAGPTVLFWTIWDQTGSVVEKLRGRVGDTVSVARVHFAAEGAHVVEL